MRPPWYIKTVRIDKGSDGLIWEFRIHWLFKIWLKIKIISKVLTRKI